MKTHYIIAIVSTLVVLSVLAVAGTPLATCQLPAGDPNAACVPVPADPTTAGFSIDPNQVVGTLLPPRVAQAGKFNHVLRACDPDGDAFTVELIDSPLGWTITAGPGTVLIAGDLPVGVSYARFRVVDAPTNAGPAEGMYTLAVRGLPRANTAPVLY